MDIKSDFEMEMKARMEELEKALSGLSSRVDMLSGGFRAPNPRLRPQSGAPHFQAVAGPSRGADWWLARAGAALTVVALILLYQYAVGHGWITPEVRVFTGFAVGAGLIYWGRKMVPAEDDAPFPVALRELMMGSGLAAWYITAFAACLSYHLISIPAARFVFLILSIFGAFVALNERRALLAIIAIGTGFAAPVFLSSSSQTIPAFSVYLGVLVALSVYLYLMRGWQSILWISFLSLSGSIAGVGSIHLPLFGDARISLALLIIAAGLAYTRAPALRRQLMGTGSDRYTEPVRSTFARTWLGETGRLLRFLSPLAGSADSFSLWLITLAAPLMSLGLLSSVWPGVNDAVWGALAIVMAGIAFRKATVATDGNDETAHVLTVAAVVWSLAGLLVMTRPFGDATGADAGAIALALLAIYPVAILKFLRAPRFAAAMRLGRLLAALAILIVILTEAGTLGNVDQHSRAGTLVSLSFTFAELAAIGAGIFAWREMTGNTSSAEASGAIGLASYLAFLFVDARVLGAIWPPLVTATYAIAGTALLLAGRNTDSRPMQQVGGATLALVVGRLMFVDLVGVDTIWRVLLFLGCGALFLFTSHQMQTARKQPPPGPA